MCSSFNQPPRISTNRRIRCAPLCTTTTAMERSPMSPKKPRWAAKGTTVRAWPWPTLITTAFPIFTSPGIAVPFFITTTAMGRLRMSPQKPESPMKAAGQPARDGLITTRMAGSIWSSRTTSTGARRTMSGAASTVPATGRIVIRETTKDRRPSSITTITTGPLRM